MRNNKVGNSLIFTVLLVFSSHSYSLGLSGWTTVTEIIQGLGSKPTVKLANTGNATTGCPSTGQLRFRDVNSLAGQRHFSTLLAALTSGKEVRIQTSECSSDYAYIDYVYIRN